MRPLRRRVALALIAAVFAVLVTALPAPQAVHACSGLSVEPADASVVAVVAGYITELDYEEHHSSNPLETFPVTMTVEVDRYLRGGGPASVQFVAKRSAGGDSDDINWGAGGAICGGFFENPLGRYFVLAIPSTLSTEGDFTEGDFSVFHVYGRGDGPADPGVTQGIDWVLERLSATTVVQAPGGGNAGLAAHSTQLAGGWNAAMAVGLLVALLAVIRWRVGRAASASR
jgi:hypothetical protein